MSCAGVYKVLRAKGDVSLQTQLSENLKTSTRTCSVDRGVLILLVFVVILVYSVDFLAKTVSSCLLRRWIVVIIQHIICIVPFL